jgi:outer membrane receptor protein involved in Fe transport
MDLQTAAKAQDEELKEIEVRSTIRREELESTSATVLSNDDVADRVYPSPLYMLRQSPGVRIREINEGGVVSPMMIRGFTGAHFGDIGFYFDGIPLNDSGHSDNYSDTTVLIPLEIESLEIIKGPVSALYGKGNGAGTAAFQGIKRGDFTRMMIRLGLYNTIDAQGIIAKDVGKLHHVYAFQVYNSDSWRDNSNWKRFNLSTRWTYDVSDQFEISLNLRAAFAKWDTALQALSWQDPKHGSDDGSGQGNMSGGHRDRFDARIFANYFLSDNSQISSYVFTTSLENNMAEIYLDITNGPYSGYSIGDLPEGNTDLTGKRTAFGTGLAYNFKTTFFGNHDFNLSLGADYLIEEHTAARYQLAWGYGNRHFEQLEDYKFNIKTLSFFAQSNYQLLENLRIRLGGRYDQIRGDIDYGPHQPVISNTHYDSKTLGIFSPKIGLLYTPIEQLQIYANYGKGFNLPGLNDGRFFSEHQLKLTERDQYELGFRASPYSWMDFGSVYFFAETSNDVEKDYNTNKIVNAGQTRRQGIETYVKFFPIEYLTIYADYSYHDVRYKLNSANPWMNGRRLINVPRHIFNVEVSYRPDQGLGGRASFNWNADLLLRNDPRTTTYNGVYYAENFGTLDLQLNYRFNEKYKINLDVTNVFNDRPRHGVPNQNGYFAYWPANPTAAYLTFEVDFDK